MPTENLSSTIEQHDHIEGIIDMVSVPEGYMLVERSIWTEKQVDAATACITRLKGVPAMTDRALAMAAIDAAQCTAPDIALTDLLPIPQPHAEPIAWMVGTAFWWTKEEAERDAAATGKRLVPFGPMTVTCSPDEQHQVEPVALPEKLPGCKVIAAGWNQCLDVIAKLGPLYPRPAQTEAGEDNSPADIDWNHVTELEAENYAMGAQLAERDALLRELLADDVPLRLAAKIETALSASAEPRAPIAWHVGGNGYDRICFEEPTDLPGHPCIQPLHDQRQLIELLKRYDLRDEDVPPDERAHGIPGTSFQRLNALANQGE